MIGPIAVAAPQAQPPAIAGGIRWQGTHPKFTAFAASATAKPYGAVEGYATLKDAINDLTMLTVGVRQPAAGIFELNGRFHGRMLDNEVTFASGKAWAGMWRLEQFPLDKAVLAPELGATRSDNLRFIVDGAVHFDPTALPVTDLR
jgi:hypothetical protein